jgi:DNA helicase-2/ATP-dependent DNA helicase PcrA
VVGDDDQSIYRWRGADIHNILDFEKDYPNTKVFRLEQNYRSTQTILDVAMSVVVNNKERKEKRLWTDREKGEKAEVLEAVDDADEARLIAEKIREEVFKKKRAFRDFAILYRTNAQSRAIEDRLRRCGFAYVIVGGVRFYERKEIKDILAYLKCIVNPSDTVSLLRIINFPLRGIGDMTIKKINRLRNQSQISFFEALGRVDESTDLSPRIRRRILDFYELLNKYINLKNQISLNELVHTLIEEVGLLSLYKEDTSIESQGRMENIREFQAAIDEFVVLKKEATLSQFLEEVSLVTDVDEWDEKGNAITLMTLHCAKGLEFPVVMIAGIEDGLLPLSRSLDDPESLEEERRLFYVGITRAQDKLILLWAGMRQRFNENSYRLPSRFLREINSSMDESIVTISRQKEYEGRKWKGDQAIYADQTPDYESYSQEFLNLQPGLWVKHDTYGKGQITRVEGKGMKQKVSVRFEDGIEKKFITQYAQFTLL